MKTALLQSLVIAAGLAGATQAQACIGWRIATNGWNHAINANGLVNGQPLHRPSTDLDDRHDLDPGMPMGTGADVRHKPARPLPSLRELASHPLAH